MRAEATSSEDASAAAACARCPATTLSRLAKPFRFGIAMTHQGPTEAFVEHARRAEDLGYSTLQAFDELAGVPFTPLPALAFAAAATSTIRLSAYVLDNGYRHPILLAKEAATLDVLSAGRLELGLGAGYSEEEYRGRGIAFPPAAERVGRLEESVEILARAFSGDPVTYAGRYYTIENASCIPMPVQRPRPHLLIGGARERLLTFAARNADTVSLAFSGPGGFEVDASEERTLQKLDWIRRAAGPRLETLEIEALVNVRFGASRAAAAAEGSARSGVPAEWLLRSPHLLYGTPDEMAETLQERRERFGISYFSVRPRSVMEQFTEVIRLVAT